MPGSKRSRTELDRLLGMDRAISRRDFLHGSALSLVGLALSNSRPSSAAPAGPPSGYIPELGGLRGQDAAATQLAHRLRAGEFADLPKQIEDTGELYDLIVVGAGLAGLAAAYVYHREKRGRCRILLLDNHDDFGGHARRNTFHHQGTTLIANGGDYALEEPEHSPPEAREILDHLGVDPERMAAFRDPEFQRRFGLSAGVCFDPRWCGASQPAWINRFYDIPYETFFAAAPIAEPERRELIELYTTRKNYLAGAADPMAALAAMSWEQFIRQRMGLGDMAVRFANLYATDLVGLGCDAVSAAAGYEIGPGFAGMGGPGFTERGGILRYAYDPQARFPDGNHTIARMLLRAILPAAVPGGASMEEVFNSRVRYEAFDRPEQSTRLRLRSLAVRVEHDRPRTAASKVWVHYVQPDGRLRRACARGAVVAGWGLVAKRIVPELEADQLEALSRYRYTSSLYINVLLRQWLPIAKCGMYEMYLPDGYCTWMHVADPLRLGGYRPEYDPERPTVLSLYKYIYQPGLDPDAQMTLGRIEMEQRPFETYEREIRAELHRLFGPHGFRPAEDILAITVNRWGHGYCFFDQPRPRGAPAEPFVRARHQLGRISFAGADAGGSPWSQQALQQGRRAALEQLG